MATRQSNEQLMILENLKADTVIDDENFDDVSAVVLPGGMPGTLNLGNNEKLCALLKKCAEEKILISALCAAPSVLGKLSILKGREFTFPVYATLPTKPGKYPFFIMINFYQLKMTYF